MDLFGELHARHLREYGSSSLEVAQLRPAFRRGVSRVGAFDARGRAFAVDRAINRLWLYPRFVRQQHRRFDVLHLMDHSYSQLVHSLPAGRTVVTCHDLDTFRCLLEPERERRSLPFRMMTAHILDGFKQAARIVCVSHWTLEQVLLHRLVPREKLTVVPLGAAPEFTTHPNPIADAESARLLERANVAWGSYLLHVGSVAPRKRIDTLLRTFAAVRKEMPQVRLVRVGGEFEESHRKLLATLNIQDAVAVISSVSRAVLASLYRGARVVLLPSEREGYGLPLVEAMASGVRVIASELAVLREVGEDAADYCPVGDWQAWANATVRALRQQAAGDAEAAARVRRGLYLASLSSPARYAERMMNIYRAIGS